MSIDAKKTLTSLLALSAAAMPCAAATQALAANSPGGASAPTATAPAPSAPAQPASPSRAKVRSSGVATWFGPGFYGKKTACGQTLTPSVVGVAHRTLPCGTLVKVAWHGHSLTVPVIDRGPYSHIADWDLTAGAAQALGITETVRIGTRVVGRTANVASLGGPLTEPSASMAGATAAPSSH